MKSLFGNSKLSVIILFIFCLISVGCSQEVNINGLIKKLEDSNLDQERIVAMLVRIGTPAVGPLIAALKDTDSAKRSGAAKALGKIKDSHAAEPLINALKDEYPSVQCSAAQALGEIKDSRAVKPLIAALKYQSFDSFINCYDCGTRVQDSVRQALENIGIPAVDALIVALKDTDSQIRGNAATVLANIKDYRAIEALVMSMSDKDSWVRARRKEALVTIGLPAVEPLIAVLKNENPDVRQNAVEALGKIKDSRAVEPLMDTLKDKNLNVRRNAAEALGEIGDHRAVERLLAALEDEDTYVKIYAAEAIGRMGMPVVDTVKEKCLLIVAENYGVFIARGKPGIETVLVEALYKYGSREMAEDFGNCGNDQLASAAGEWSTERGYYWVETLSAKDKGISGPFDKRHLRWGGR